MCYNGTAGGLVKNGHLELTECASTLETWDTETRIEVRHGDPADEILAVEADTTPLTILVGSKGPSRIRRLLLGSVSEGVVA